METMRRLSDELNDRKRSFYFEIADLPIGLVLEKEKKENGHCNQFNSQNVLQKQIFVITHAPQGLFLFDFIRSRGSPNQTPMRKTQISRILRC
jgi:hypothetical protein